MKGHGRSARPAAGIAYATAVLLLSGAANADYRDDIGYRLLQQELGGSMPAGAGVPVMQVEAAQYIDRVWTYLPDPASSDFAGKTITGKSGSTSGVYSGHATAVGQLFYGVYQSSAPSITTIDAYKSSSWIFADFLRTADAQSRQPLSSAARVASHSWIATAAPYDVDALSRLDWVIARDEFTHAIGLSNSNPNQPLLSTAYNVIATGVTTGQHGSGSVALDAIYTGGRIRPDVVAPAATTSTATAEVASVAALLVGVGQGNPGLSTDPVSQSVTSRTGTVVRNAARSEVIKAVLMAGAARVTANTSTSDISDYRVAPVNQAANGLDVRFGAGQLNVLNSYAIIAEGEQNSFEDFPAGNGLVAAAGFDYDPAFGGSGATNDTATYYLPASATHRMLTAGLVWNLKIHGGTASSFNSTATFYNFDLELFDVSNPLNRVSVGYARSTTDNTENLWLPLTADRSYALQVTRATGQAAFNWDYALAWHTIPAPAADTDGDGIDDPGDNCTNVSNPNQTDSDGDGFGNRCDGDLNNNGVTNSQDYLLFRAEIAQPSLPPTYNAGDFDANGAVNSQDYLLLRQMISYPPGPSGLVP